MPLRPPEACLSLSPFLFACLSFYVIVSFRSSIRSSVRSVIRGMENLGTRPKRPPRSEGMIRLVPASDVYGRLYVCVRACVCQLVNPSSANLSARQFIHSFTHSFILNIYIAPLQESYALALPTPARLKRAVLR